MEFPISSDSKDSPICIRNPNGNANDGALLRIKRRRCDLSTDEISGLTHETLDIPVIKDQGIPVNIVAVLCRSRLYCSAPG